MKAYHVMLDNVTVKESKVHGGTMRGGQAVQASLWDVEASHVRWENTRGENTRVHNATLVQPKLHGGNATDSVIRCDAASPCELRNVDVTRGRIENATVIGGSLLDVVLVNVNLVDVEPRQSSAEAQPAPSE